MLDETPGCRVVDVEVNRDTRRQLLAAIKRANVAVWDDLFQTLRRSCEIEWALSFPQYAVSKWIGHSIHVSGKHYANSIPDELFDRVSKSAEQATQNPTLHGADSSRTPSQDNKSDQPRESESEGKTAECEEVPTGATPCDVPEKSGRQDTS